MAKTDLSDFVAVAQTLAWSCRNGTILNNGVRLKIRFLWQKFFFLSEPHAFAFCKNYPVNALCHQEQNFPYHHKGKAIPWVLSFFWHIGKVTYCIFHGGLCLPSFPCLLFYFLSHWQNSLVNWGTLPKCFSLKQYKHNTQLQHNESQLENIGRRNLN